MASQLDVDHDNLSPRFSSNFMDNVDITKLSSKQTAAPDLIDPLAAEMQPSSDTNAMSPVSPTNPFRSESPTPSDNGPTLDQGFDFADHLETRDSTSSLDMIGNMSDTSLSPTHHSGGDTAVFVESNGVSTTQSNVIARSSEQWERFDEKEKQMMPENGGVIGAVKANGDTNIKAQEKWETFEDTALVSKKLLSAVKKSDESASGGAVCAADAMISDSQWTALDDSKTHEYEYDDDKSLPFRKTQSMRATTNRKVQVVDALRQRRLSNSSLDREQMRPLQFKNEDELTRKFQVEREWQIFVKMDKRVPGTKTKWLPVNISITDGMLVIKRSTPPSMPISSSTVVAPDTPPLHEFHLHHNHMVTPPVLRRYDRKTKLHQIKIRQTQVHERRTLRRWLFVEHVSTAKTFIKLGSSDLTTIQSLFDQLNEALRQLPVTRQKGVAYRINEVFIDVKENTDILMNCDGAVLERKSLNRIYIQAFLSQNPECKLYLNDIEAILLQGKGQMTNSMSRQVRLNDVVLHPCVDKTSYKNAREIKFRPLDGYPFELLRSSIDPYVSPPINVNALMEFNEQRNTVRITASFSLRKKHNIRLRPIKDLLIKFPIASSWSSLFLADTKFGGKKSVRSTAGIRGSFRRKIKSSDCQLETHVGSAKYEPEHGAVLWRIGNYVSSELPHTFTCDIQLKSNMHQPDITKEHCDVSYTLPGSSTGLEVRGFKVQKCTPERWVKYEIHYSYKVQMFPDLSID